MALIKIIGENLASLTRFSGRQTRAQFWPYAFLVFVIAWVAGFAAITPEITASMARMQEFVAAHPDMGTIEQGPGHMTVRVQGHHPELMPNMAALGRNIAIVAVGFIFLLGAAIVRRLHDVGKSGMWGLLPVPFLVFGLVMMAKVFNAETLNTGLFFLIFINNLIYLGSLVTLVVLLAQKSEAGENRYGPGLIA